MEEGVRGDTFGFGESVIRVIFGGVTGASASFRVFATRLTFGETFGEDVRTGDFQGGFTDGFFGCVFFRLVFRATSTILDVNATESASFFRFLGPDIVTLVEAIFKVGVELLQLLYIEGGVFLGELEEGLELVFNDDGHI